MSEIFLQQLWPWFPRSNSHRHAQQESKLWLKKIKRKDKLKNVNCIYIYKTRFSLGTHLEPDGVFMFPLHVIYMPCHSLHGIYGIQHHIIALSVLVQVVFYFLRQREKNRVPLFLSELSQWNAIVCFYLYRSVCALQSLEGNVPALLTDACC